MNEHEHPTPRGRAAEPVDPVDPDDEFLQAVLEGRPGPAPLPDETAPHDPVSGAARRRLESGDAGAVAPPPSASRRRHTPATGPATVRTDATGAEVVIGAVDVEPEGAPRRRRRRTGSTGTSPAAPVADRADEDRAAVAPAPRGDQLPRTQNLLVAPPADTTPPEFRRRITEVDDAAAAGTATDRPEGSPTALSAGLARPTGPDTAEISAVEAASPWSRLQAPGDDDVPLHPFEAVRARTDEPVPAREPAPVIVPDDDVDRPGGARRTAVLLAVLALLVLVVLVLVFVVY